MSSEDKSKKKSKEVEVPKEPIVSDSEEGEETQAESSMMRAERLAREREWMLKMEEREEERWKAEFVSEERRIQREE